MNCLIIDNIADILITKESLDNFKTENTTIKLFNYNNQRILYSYTTYYYSES